MIAYCSPDYMPDENELNDQARKKYKDTSVNKRGQISHPENMDLEKPMRQVKSKTAPLKKKKP